MSDALTNTYRPQKITRQLIETLAKIPGPEKPKEIRDPKDGLVLRHQPSGYLGLYVELGRGKRERICNARDISDDDMPMTITAARNKAKELRGKDVSGTSFKKRRQEARAVPTLKEWLDSAREYVHDDKVVPTYGYWVVHNRRDGEATLARLRLCFLPTFGNHKLDEITVAALDSWQTKRLKSRSPVTVDTEVRRFKAALGKAVKRPGGWGLIDRHPLAGHQNPKVDQHRRAIRRLADDEVVALRAALDRREANIRQRRDSGNAHRERRGVEPLPALDHVFVDALKPAVEIALATGMRKSELLGLRWQMIDLKGRVIRLPGERTKAYLSREIEIGPQAAQILRTWNLQHGRPTKGFVFPGVAGRLTSLKKSFYKVLADADIERENSEGKVTWHSLRHTFGSRAAENTDSLVEVMEMMGHANLTTTQRYLKAQKHRKRALAERIERAYS